jgi:hypothetical protein
VKYQLLWVLNPTEEQFSCSGGVYAVKKGQEGPDLSTGARPSLAREDESKTRSGRPWTDIGTDSTRREMKSG